jgi:hypothetical protein
MHSLPYLGFLSLFILPSSALPGTNDAGNRDINTGRVRRRLAQQVHVGTAQLLGQSETGHAAVVLHLGVPVRGGLDVVGQGGLDEPGGDGVDADAVLSPLHGEGVCHVADGALGTTIGSGRSGLVEGFC